MKNLLLLIVFVLSYVFVDGQNTIRIENTDCFLEDCSAISNFPNIEFGYLNVPENYEKPDGNWIKVAYGIIKADESIRKPEPILVFAGGWGLPEVHRIFGFAKNFPIKNRDIILYDYRGSGHSIPNLCPDLGRQHWDVIKKDLNMESFYKELNKQYYDCFDDIEKQGIDYTQYGTETKTKDALVLIEKLGYKEVNLVGVSNGTMGIQGFIRASENSNIKIRSIVSDSNVPMAIYDESIKSLDYKAVLDKILNDCENDPNCSNAFPDLKQRFYDFIKTTLNKPLVYNGDQRIVLNTYEINSIIHQLLYNSKYYKDIPILLEALIANDIGFFGQLSRYFENRVASTSGASIVNFTYDWKAGQEKVARDHERNLKNIPEFMISSFWLDFYIKNSTITSNPRDTIPVTSTSPALILSGEYDPITPPRLSEIMHRRYSNSYYYEFPKVGHGAVHTDCGEKIFKDFIENPNQKPNSSCLEQMNELPIQFTTSYYDNPIASNLFLKLLIEKNVIWIIAFVLPILCSLVYLILQLIRLKRKSIPLIKFFLAFAILVFLIALIYFMYRTFNSEGLILYFGLVSSAWWLPWLGILILLLSILFVVRMLRSKDFGFWNLSLLFSTIFMTAIYIRFGFLPI